MLSYPILSAGGMIKSSSLLSSHSSSFSLQRTQFLQQQRLISSSTRSNNYTSMMTPSELDDAHANNYSTSAWTSRDSFEFMLDRPWQHVIDFYSDTITTTTTSLFSSSNFGVSEEEVKLSLGKEKQRGGRWARLTFKIVLSYHGPSFDGWQKQPGGLNTVQESVETSLGRFVDEKKAQQLRDRGLPLQGNAVVAGRTDKGVSALHQVCSFYTWRKDVKAQDIMDAFSGAEQGKLRIVSVTEVSRVFHPNFCAKWRRYLYIFPLKDGEEDDGNSTSGGHAEKTNCGENHGSKFAEGGASVETVSDCLGFDEDMFERKKKPTRFSISKVNQLLRHLEGKLLSYKMFARDTKASRNIGPPTECLLFHARAAEARIPNSLQDGEGTKVMCVELVGNRFLRKMVRVLVATAIREAAARAEDDALINLMGATCRRATAPPAPPEGLCLVDVGYSEFDRQICFIS